MSRQYCKRCAYPITTCVCGAIETLALPNRVIILQHKNESKHAKNTARLAKLVSPSIEIVDVSGSASLSILSKSLLTSEVLVLYPNNTSIAIESYIQEHAKNAEKNDLLRKPITLILIDANWRQAYGIWQQQKWLKAFTHCHFDNLPSKQYVIRKSKKAHQLSTIEALAHSLEIISGVSGQAYLNVFSFMQRHWTRHQKE
jgi:DTW domain-containing protein YfiP